MDVTNATGTITGLVQMTLSWYDYTLFTLMLGLSAVIGIYFGFFGKQATADDYLLGGRTMKVIPIAISLTASNISGITFLAVPTDVYRYGATYWLHCISMVILYFTIYYVYLPVFYKLQLTSVYEYLQLRFCGKIRLLSSFLFTLFNIPYLPIVTYIPALAFAQATGINIHLITPIVCGVCVFYTTIGGLKAVVWTDTLQFIVMVGSTLGVCYLGIVSVGGFGAMWQKNVESQRLQLDFDLDPTKRDTFLGTLLGTFFTALNFSAINQGCVQKYISMPTFHNAKKALQLYLLGMVLISSSAVLTGLIMYARYSNCDPFSAGKISRQDEILPYYMMDVASSVPGLAGLFLSGIFSAALSSLSATMNCLSASVYEDFVSPFMSKDISQKSVSNVLKLIVMIIGIISTALVFVVEQMGSILPIYFCLAGITGGPLIGIFSLGLLLPMANSKGALYGGLGSITVMSFIVIGSQFHSIQYPPKPLTTIGCNVTITPMEPKMMNGEDNVYFLFKISHYYFTVLGTLLVFIIGIPFSWITRKEDDPLVDKDLICPISQWMFKEQNNKGKYCDVTEALEMITQKILGTLLVFIIGIPFSWITRKEDDPLVDKDLICPISQWMFKEQNNKGKYCDVTEALEMITQKILGTLLVFIIGIPFSWITRKEDDPLVDKDLICPISQWMFKEQNNKGKYCDVTEALEMITQKSEK